MRGESRIGLEEGILLEEFHHVGIGSVLCGIGVGEIAIQLRRREDLIFSRVLQLRQSLSLVCHEEEKTVPPVELRKQNWPADSSSELITLQGVLGKTQFVIEKRIGVKDRVTDVVISAAMKIVAAGPGDHADDPPGITAVLRSVVAGQDAELLDGVRIRIQHCGVAQQVVVDTAIQDERYGIGARAGDAK